MRQLGKAAHDAVPGAAQGTGQSGSDAIKRLKDPLVALSLRIRVLLGIGVLYLMVVKPDLAGTLVAVGVSLVVGIAAGIAA
jgi:hypothetical protein